MRFSAIYQGLSYTRINKASFLSLHEAFFSSHHDSPLSLQFKLIRFEQLNLTFYTVAGQASSVFSCSGFSTSFVHWRQLSSPGTA